MGAFEHYPHLKPLDGSWANYCRLLDGPLYFYDTASKRIGEGGEWETMAYTTYSVVSWYGLAAPANTTRAVEWPKADYEVSFWVVQVQVGAGVMLNGKGGRGRGKRIEV